MSITDMMMWALAIFATGVVCGAASEDSKNGSGFFGGLILLAIVVLVAIGRAIA